MGKKTLKISSKKLEGSKADKASDKKHGAKEGSKKDKAADMALAKKMKKY